MKYFIITLFLVLFILGCSNEPIACTEEAKVCPDGSSVGRVLPNCEFAECPTLGEVVESTMPVPGEDVEEMIVKEEPDVVIDQNLVAHYKFDGNAEDYSNDYDGTIRGNAQFIAGKEGKAILLDGIDDYIDFPQETIDTIGSLSKGTIAFWFKFESLLNKQTIMPIFYIGGDEKDIDNMYIIEIGHFDESSFSATPTPNPEDKKIYSTWIKENRDPYLCFDSNKNIEENKWYHYAVVVSEQGNTGYLNGVEMTSRDYNFGKASDKSFLADISNKKKLMLGYGRSSHMLSPDFIYFKGYLDDFRIYDRALTSEEILQVMEE